MLDRYIELALEKRRIEAEMKMLQPSIISQLEELEDPKLQKDGITIILSFRKNWQYSTEVKSLADDLKVLQQREQIKGIAEFSLTKYLQVRKA